MRKTAVLVLVVATACTTQELAPTTSAISDPSTTTDAVSSTPPSPAPSTTAAEPTTTTTLPELQGLVYEEVAQIDFPIHMVPRNSTHSLLATKDGRIWWYDGTIEPDPALDISDKVRDQGEQGLLSIAVQPRDDGRLFVHYTANDGDTVVEEYRISEHGVIEPEPVRQLLRLNQPAGNHNGGMIQFGPDDALYLGLGDGGGSNDRFNNGQDQETLLGGLVRFEVQFESPGDVSEPELFQYGLRNPWRFWIDGEVIYIADVGQNAFEEISVASLEPGVNYGWPITEGLHCFRPSSGCDTAGLTLPVIEVRHGDSDTCSITGGLVYWGPAIPEIQGQFFYSDYCGGYLRSLRSDEGVVGEVDWTDEVGNAGSVASFGLDHDGEMYVLTTDRIFKVVPVR